MTTILGGALITLILLATNYCTFLTMQKRVEDLKLALQAKRALLGPPLPCFEKTHSLAAGDTLTLTDQNENFMEIKSSHATTLDIKVFDR